MRRIIDALHRVHTLIPVMTDLDILLERIIAESQEVAGAEAASLLLYDAEKNDLYFHVALGDRGDALKSVVRLNIGQGIAGQAAESREPIFANDAPNDPRFFREADEAVGFETRSLLAIPMVERDTLVGVLEVINKHGTGGFTQADVRVMGIFSAIVGSVIDNARLIDEKFEAQRLAAIGQAVAGLSHYTKNLVSGLSGSVELIDEGIESNNYEMLERSWPVFKRSTKRVSNFAEDMLAYSKPREPVRKPTLLPDVFDEVTETFWGLLVKKDITLDVDVSAAADPVNIDRDAIHRCLINLVVNAADAAPPTGAIIRMAGTIAEGSLIIEVSDNGSGISEKVREKIFDPFFSTKGAKGTGLGLAVTHKIVTEHGGTITVDKGPAGGAHFQIRLPGVA